MFQDYLNKLANYHRFISYWLYLGGNAYNISNSVLFISNFIGHILYLLKDSHAVIASTPSPLSDREGSGHFGSER